MDSNDDKTVGENGNLDILGEFGIEVPSGPPIIEANQNEPVGLENMTTSQLNFISKNWTPQQVQDLANLMKKGANDKETPGSSPILNMTGKINTDPKKLVANQELPTSSGACAGNNEMTSPNLELLDDHDRKLAEQVMAFCMKKTPTASETTKSEEPGAKAKAELASELAKKHNVIQSDVNRLVQCKSFKARLVNRVFKPLDTRSIGMFLNVNNIPTWNNQIIQDRVKEWAIRGAEMLRQGLLMSIEVEMAKLNARRVLVKVDAEKANPEFEMVREARKSLNL